MGAAWSAVIGIFVIPTIFAIMACRSGNDHQIHDPCCPLETVWGRGRDGTLHTHLRIRG